MLTESQEQALESTFVPTLPLRVEHAPLDTRQCRWYVVDAVNFVVECFPSESDALEAAARITTYYSTQHAKN